MRLYLASTSPARLATLRAAGIEPILLSSGVDEEAAVAAAGPLTAPEMVLLLARLKAEAVVDCLVDGAPIDGFILGGDSAFEFDGVTYGKPHLPSVARERWLAQRGREGFLHSGHWLIDHRAGGPSTSSGTALAATGAVSTARVRFASSITEREIDDYIATGEPLEVAGAFTIDSMGGAFIQEIDGDPHAVVGLSLATLRELLLQFDVHWPDLWNRS
ncbi:MAG TPA: Maf family protein [Galbitalea sp.]